MLVTQSSVSSGDSWTVNYNNGQTFEFDMYFSGQWPILYCKNAQDTSVQVWFQGNSVFVKTASGYSQFIGFINANVNNHYKVVCNNTEVSLFSNGNFVGSATDGSFNVPSNNFENHPLAFFLASGETHMTNFSISDSEQNEIPVITSLTVPTTTQIKNTPIEVSAEFTDENMSDTHTATIDWGDGNTTPGSVSEASGLGTVSGSHEYTQGGNYIIKLTVIDQDNAGDDEQAQIHVNLPIIIDRLDNTLTNSGTMYTAVGGFTDIDSTSWVGTVDYGDGSAVQNLQIDQQNHTFSLNHQYNQNAVTAGYTVTLSITDNQGETVSTPPIKVSTILWQNKILSEDDWTVSYNNGQIYEFDLYYDLQWPVLVCKSSGSDNVAVWFQTNEVYAKTSSGYSQKLGNINKDINTHYKVICDNNEVSVYADGNLVGSASDSSMNLAMSNTNNPTVVFLANGNITSMTNFTISTNIFFQVTLTSTADSYIKQGSDNQNEGASTFMRIQSSGHNRGLVRFDESQLESAIGNNENYTAKLQLTISDNGNNWGSGRTVDIHRLTSNWTEGNGFIVGNNPQDRGTGSGVTWACAVDSNIANQNDDCSGSNAWNMTNSSQWPFISGATDTQTISNNQTGIVEFDVTEDVQSFINGSNQNYGWLIKKTEEGQNGMVQFSSKETSNSPKLVITPN